jgi:hypothetical protein
MITCPNCGQRNTNAAHNCGNCGTALKEEQTERGESQTSNVEPAARRSTPLASHSNQLDGGTMQHIEQSLSPSIYCSNCGEKLSSDANFCWRCGKEFKNDIEKMQLASVSYISQRKEIPMQKWEYLKIWQARGFSAPIRGAKPTEYDEIDLTKLGNEGWELVSVTPESGIYGEHWAGITNALLWVFKRPRA